jgi:tRNA(Ile)-lysidine synthase
MRYRALADACRDAGVLHLLLGHHAADQAETLAMRVLRGSQTHGLAGMAALRETATLRLLRPLLGVQPEELRGYLDRLGIRWVEDPSNQDVRALRPRLRRGFAAHGAQRVSIGPAMAAVGVLREREETLIAAELAARADIRPEGFALLSPGPISAASLSSLVRMIAGADYPPNPAQVAALAAQPRAATIAGVRLIEIQAGLLIVREEAAIADPVEVSRGVVWDNRFRVTACDGVPSGCTVGKLGDDAARIRGSSPLPAVILRTAPAIRLGGKLASVPHIGYVDKLIDAPIAVLFSPPGPVSGASFVPAAWA